MVVTGCPVFQLLREQGARPERCSGLRSRWRSLPPRLWSSPSSCGRSISGTCSIDTVALGVYGATTPMQAGMAIPIRNDSGSIIAAAGFKNSRMAGDNPFRYHALRATPDQSAAAAIFQRHAAGVILTGGDDICQLVYQPRRVKTAHMTESSYLTRASVRWRSMSI